MRIRLTLLLFIIWTMMTLTVIAQETATPDLDGTATQAIVNASLTAEFLTNQPPITETPDPFALTATALIVQATQRAGSVSNDPNNPTVQALGAEFGLTATQLIVDATNVAASSDDIPNTAQAEANSPLGLTLIIFGLVVFVLVVIGGAYLYISNRSPIN